MESHMTIVLSDREREALRAISQRELRPMRDQARYLLRAELERRGLLQEAAGPDQEHGGEVALDLLRACEEGLASLNVWMNEFGDRLTPTAYAAVEKLENYMGAAIARARGEVTP